MLNLLFHFVGVAVAIHPLQQATLQRLARELPPSLGRQGLSAAEQSALQGQAVAAAIFENDNRFQNGQVFANHVHSRKNPSGLFFSGVFGHGMVLQRGPEKASVFGKINGTTSPANTKVSVTVTPEDGSSYSVKATVNADMTWKALLEPEAAGGSYEITAECTTCSTDNQGSNSQTLHNVTFGDIWVCAGSRFSVAYIQFSI
jgi:hypothetical protein